MRTKVRIANLTSEMNKIKGLEISFTKRIKSVMHSGGLTLRAMLRDAAPKFTGALAKSFRFRTARNGEAFDIFSDDPKLQWITDGTKPHTIRARFKKALYWAGASSPFAKVFHPGTKPNSFVQDQIDQFTPKLIGNFEKEFGGDKQ